MPAKRELTRRGHALWAPPRYDNDWTPKPPAWQEQALCREVDPELFFVEIGPAIEARQVCSLCPVRDECLDWALTFEADAHGIFGGVGPKARAQMRHGGGAVAA